MSLDSTLKRVSVTRRPKQAPQRGWIRVVGSDERTLRDRLIQVDVGGLEIGREPRDPDSLVLLDALTSRRHACVVWDGEQAMVCDLGSANGTRVDGVALAEHTPTPLRDGAVIRVGDTVLLWLRREPTAAPGDNALGIFGRSPDIERIRQMIRLLGPSDLPVLVHGPTGAGKELVAHALHATSRRDGELVAINCPALPGNLAEDALFGHVRGAFTGAGTDHDGAFVRADRGTLFLDEVGDMELALQPKLLRALETGMIAPIGGRSTRKVDIRLVTATNVDLKQAVSGGLFREDLLARIAGAIVEVPPLSARPDDVWPLFRRFLEPGAAARDADADFVESLLCYPWPRNVREVRNLARRLEVLHPGGRRWEASMLDPDMRYARRAEASPAAEPPTTASAPALVRTGAVTSPAPRDTHPTPKRGAARPPTREELMALLDQFDGNVSEVARHVGRNRKQVYRWMRKHDVTPGVGRD